MPVRLNVDDIDDLPNVLGSLVDLVSDLRRARGRRSESGRKLSPGERAEVLDDLARLTVAVVEALD